MKEVAGMKVDSEEVPFIYLSFAATHVTLRLLTLVKKTRSGVQDRNGSIGGELAALHRYAIGDCSGLL